MNWDLTDFIVAGALLGALALAAAVTLRLARSWTYRAAAALAALTVFMLLWSNAAVSIVGGDGNAFSPLYNLVPLLGLVAAAVVRFRAAGMARVMIGMALGTALLSLAAIAGLAEVAIPGWQITTLGITALFATLFLASAWLFHRAAGTSSGPSAATPVGA
ncbi:hypothetical protein [Maricaulis sp. CAU 1757]